jgi:hypothetical protein
MAEEASTIFIEAGPNQQVRYELGSEDYEQLNNNKGSDGTYVNGTGRPSALTGHELMLHDRVFREARAPGGTIAAHRGPGEALYLSVQALAVDQLDTSAFTFEIHEQIVDVATGARREETWGIAHANESVSTGGVAADPFTVIGQRIPAIALPRLGPTEYGRLFGFIKVVTADQ